jgi:hypothetical protein
MNDELMNRLTLECLTSNKMKYKIFGKVTEHELPIETRQIYKQDLYELFDRLFENDVPENLLPDIKKYFDMFIKKSVDYFEKLKEIRQLEEEELKKEMGDDYLGEEEAVDE